ncbi:hypothetical protein [Paraflavitalea speifideaquila]|uniref:hypothetical protein n=1 Tax=Paraflavitalea speifideaquila TaxID=3076558 RepID=UPI0028EA6FF5|nr:hypothetical protein [Paraflavitalea speifideiaquila]
MPRIENVIDKLNQSKTYTVNCTFSGDAKKQFELIFHQHSLKFKTVSEIKTKMNCPSSGRLMATPKTPGFHRGYDATSRRKKI